MDRSLIDRFIAQADVPARAVAGLGPQELLAHPVPDTWSIQQIVIHLWDSDAIAAHRMKRIIAEPRPLLIGYDETLFARGLCYEQLDVRQSCELFRLNRLQMGEILRRLPDAAFERFGIHNERGKVSLAEMVELYVGHVPHHMKFLREKRALLGKPLAD